MNVIKRLLLSCLASGVAFAQLSLEVNIPEGSALRISHQEVSFDLEQVGFPPPAFPAYFGPTDPTVPISIELFSNIEGGWALTVGFAGLVGEEGALLLPSQLEYRLDDGVWLSLGPSITLLTGQGASVGFAQHRLELQLQLLGNERPGAYEGTLVFSLVPL